MPRYGQTISPFASSSAAALQTVLPSTAKAMSAEPVSVPIDAGADAGGVDADNLAVQVEQRSAGVAVPDFGVVLNHRGQAAIAGEGAVEAR